MQKGKTWQGCVPVNVVRYRPLLYQIEPGDL